MFKNSLILILFVLILIGFLFLLIRKNRKDRKDLFKKLPEDYPDPKQVKSEFDNKS